MIGQRHRSLKIIAPKGHKAMLKHRTFWVPCFYLFELNIRLVQNSNRKGSTDGYFFIIVVKIS